MAFWNRRKSVDEVGAREGDVELKRGLSWPHLIALGVGAIVGTGIFTLIGVGVNLAGPGVLLSFAIVGVVCACAALAYAEMSTMMPAAGSAYTYSYAVLGELIAWIVGVSLIMEYTFVVSTVAVGWSGYAVGFWNSAAQHGASLFGTTLLEPGALQQFPAAFATGPHAGGVLNLPAMVIVAVVAGLLCLGTRESATVNAVLVGVKIIALTAFVVLTLPAFDPGKFTPLMPNGFGGPGQAAGVMAAAAIIFFAFYGFDAISTAAEETKNPGRDLPIGIVGSMVICTLIYMAVAACAVGAVNYTVFANSPEPLALILRELGNGAAAQWIAGAAVVAFPTVLLAFFFGQSRIFFVMARDGLLPQKLARVNSRGAPVVITVFTAIIVAALAGVARLDEIAALANAGTLAAFVAVSVCMLVMRVREPSRPRVFKAPLGWPVGLIAIGGCVYLFANLPHTTQLMFLSGNGVGLVIYFAYSMWNSRLAKKAA